MTAQEMLKMRIDGATFQEIADVCGVSKQCVHKKLAEYSKRITNGARGRNFKVGEIKYESIRNHFENNSIETVSSFARKVFGHDGRAATMRNFLTGDNESYFTIAQIKRMCETVGKPFEEVFKEG